jgi:hypothetical protein
MLKYKNLQISAVFLVAVFVYIIISFAPQNSKHLSPGEYKVDLLGGEVPSTWSEYGNGFGDISTPVHDPSGLRGGGYDGYAKNVFGSISPHLIMFSDVPSDRVDTFLITPELKEIMMSEEKKESNYSVKMYGKNKYDVLTLNENEEGGRLAEYFLELPDTSDGTKEVALFIEYQSTNADFHLAVERYLSTISK